MKITDVTVTLFAWKGLKPAAYSQIAIPPESDLGLLRIVTDAGVEGHAFIGTATVPASLDAAMLIRFLKPLLIGRDPLDREALHQAAMRQRRRTPIRCIGAVDVALWDIAGKVANLPIYQLLGACRRSIPAYASSTTMPDIAAYREDALAVKESGYQGYKIHPPRLWRQDIAVAQAVREAVGPDYLLMMDSTWTYDYDQALRVGRAIEALDYYWFEDPLAEWDLYSYARLREKLDVPLMATEHTPADLEANVPWLIAKATDFLRGDVAVKGGLTMTLKTAHLAEAFGMRYEVHHGGNSLNNLANLHLILAIQNTEYMEFLLPLQAQQYGLLADPEIDAQGFVHAPTGPGLGAEIDFDLIERLKIGVV